MSVKLFLEIGEYYVYSYIHFENKPKYSYVISIYGEQKISLFPIKGKTPLFEQIK